MRENRRGTEPGAAERCAGASVRRARASVGAMKRLALSVVMLCACKRDRADVGSDIYESAGRLNLQRRIVIEGGFVKVTASGDSCDLLKSTVLGIAEPPDCIAVHCGDWLLVSVDGHWSTPSGSIARCR